MNLYLTPLVSSIRRSLAKAEHSPGYPRFFRHGQPTETLYREEIRETCEESAHILGIA